MSENQTNYYGSSDFFKDVCFRSWYWWTWLEIIRQFCQFKWLSSFCHWCYFFNYFCCSWWHVLWIRKCIKFLSTTWFKSSIMWFIFLLLKLCSWLIPVSNTSVHTLISKYLCIFWKIRFDRRRRSKWSLSSFAYAFILLLSLCFFVSLIRIRNIFILLLSLFFNFWG